MFISNDYNPLSTVTTSTSTPLTISTGCSSITLGQSGSVTGFDAAVTATNTCYTTKLETTKPDFYEYWWLNLTGNNEVIVTHSGKAYGFKDDLEKQLLIEFARKFPDVEVSDYIFKMRML